MENTKLIMHWTIDKSGNGSYVTSQSNEWLGIGFLPSTYSSDSGNLNNTNTVGFNSTTPTGASPWMLARSSAGTVIGHVHETCGYVGVGANNGHTYNPPDDWRSAYRNDRSKYSGSSMDDDILR